MKKQIDRLSLSIKYSEAFESSKWKNEIPFIKFSKEWKVKVIPPGFGAIIRYIVKKGDATVSVYLDCYDLLGFNNSPYWEVYPVNNETFRCGINEVDNLLWAIKTGLEQKGL